MTIQTTEPVPLTAADQVKGKIATLQERLQKLAPGYEALLHEIHRILAKDPDLCHYLSEEEIGTICHGLSLRKGVVIATAAAKSTKKPQISMDDL